MTKKFSLDEAAILRAVQPKLDEIQAQANLAVQDVVRGVRDDMEGQPADDVYAELVKRLNEQISGMTLNHDNLRALAAEIEAGTLTG